MNRLFPLAFALLVLLSVAPARSQPVATPGEFSELEQKARSGPMSLQEFEALVRQHPGTEQEVLERLQKAHVDYYEELLDSATTDTNGTFWFNTSVWLNGKWVPINPDTPKVFESFGALGDEVLNKLPGGKKQTYKMLFSRLRNKITKDPVKYRGYLGYLKSSGAFLGDQKPIKAALTELITESYLTSLITEHDQLVASAGRPTSKEAIEALSDRLAALTYMNANVSLASGGSSAQPAYRELIDGYLQHAAKDAGQRSQYLDDLERFYTTSRKVYSYNQSQMLSAIGELRTLLASDVSAGPTAQETVEAVKQNVDQATREAAAAALQQ